MKLFKTDGIRGKFGNVVTFDLAFKLGYCLDLLNCNKVIIGYDTRYSGILLKKELEKGAKLKGLVCVDLGICSTPKLAFYSRKYEAVGVMITASHNPYYDNGLKVFKCGIKLDRKLEMIIEKKMLAEETYEDFLKKKIKLNNYKVGLDGAHGGASEIINEVFNDDNYFTINTDYNGYDINDHCGSTHPEIIRDFVKVNNLDFGFCFDGDADRVICCSKEGNILDGDYLAYIIADYYKYDQVVLTKMSNQGIIEAFEKRGIKVFLSDSGDKNVYNKMLENDVKLGAEASGHIINLEHNNTGDGILNAIDLINIINEKDIDLDSIYKEINIYFSELRNYDIVINDEDIIKLNNFIEDKLPKIISYIRKSGTEEVLRVYLQCQDNEYLKNAFLIIEDELCKL